MTLEDVGKIYLARKSEIDDLSSLIRLLNQATNDCSPSTVCSIRKDILEHATRHLLRYLDHLNASMKDVVT